MKKRIGEFKIPWIAIFMLGVFAGGLLSCIQKGVCEPMQQLGTASLLCEMRDRSMDKKSFFLYVMRKRIGIVLFMTVASSTYLGILLCMTVVFLLGLAGGIYVSASLLQYGIRGILLVGISLLPQYLIYFPAYYYLCRWCEKMREASYQKRVCQQDTSPMLILQILLIWVSFLLGCGLESYVNLPILQTFLKIF